MPREISLTDDWIVMRGNSSDGDFPAWGYCLIPIFEALHALDVSLPASVKIVEHVYVNGGGPALLEALLILQTRVVRQNTREEQRVREQRQDPRYQYAGPMHVCVLCDKEDVKAQCPTCKLMFVKTYICRDRSCYKMVGEGCHRFRTCGTFFELSPYYCMQGKGRKFTEQAPRAGWMKELECVD